ncbi:MAG TPA: aminoglycoside phosphotransferase family protein [Ktedonobacteraceae bacterium]|nr:aminoglycoside phosphotransferase family protein [Ktedonobacteraceae bacterium]
MQKDWQRQHDFVMLDEATLNAMLQPAFPGKSIKSAELLTSGLCNTNYKIHLSDTVGAFVLRLYTRDRAACQKDYDLFNLVHERVPVPELLYVDAAGERYAMAYAVMRWVDGVLLSDIISAGDPAQMAACAYAAGTTLASIGSYTFPQAGFFGPGLNIAQPFDSGTAPFLAEIERSLFAGRAGERLGTALATRLWRFVLDNSNYLEVAQKATTLVHADFKGVNILVRQEQASWHVAAVLDWEFALASSPLIDIANMLRYDRLLPATYETQFIRGYLDNGGTLPAEWKRASKLLDLLSLCQFLDAPQPGNALVEEVIGLIVGTMEHWKEYAR